ncbi:MAG: hypothetical protein ABUT39_21845 [Acidobacteriota bacterium]
MVAHEPLVHAADLLDVESGIGEALAFEEDELAEDLIDRAVVHGGDLEGGAALVVERGAAAGGPAFEEGVRVRVEQLAAARRQVEIAMADAGPDGAEESEEPVPGAEAEGHGIGVQAGVPLELLEEAEDAQVLLVERMLDGEEAFVFRIEEDDEAQEDGEEPGVEVVVFGAGGFVEEDGAVADGGSLEAAQEDVESLEDLFGQLVGDVGLAAPAVREQSRKLALAGDGEEAPGGEKHDKGVEDGPSADGGHVVDPEGERAARFAVRRMDQAQLAAVGQEPDGDADVAQEAVELGGRRVVPRSGDGFGLVERKPVRQVEDEHHGAGLVELAESQGGPKSLPALGNVKAEIRLEGVAGVEQVGREAEDLGEEIRQVADGPLAGVLIDDRAEIEQPLLDGRSLPRHALGLDEDRDGDDETLGRLDEAEPFLVKADFGVGHGGGDCSRRLPG